MKILIISQHIFPMQTPRAHRTTELVKEFAKKGHDVTVYAVLGSYNYSKFEAEHNVKVKNIRLIWQVHPYSSDGNSKRKFIDKALGRLFKRFEFPNIEFMFRMQDILNKEINVDLLLTIADPHTIHWGIARIKSKFKLRFPKIWVADCGDPYMNNGNSDHLNYFSRMEKLFCSTADYITVPHKGAVQAYYPEFHSKIRVVPQGFDFELNNMHSNAPENNIVSFAYAGVFLSDIRNPTSFFEYLTTIDEEFRFYIYTAHTSLFKKYIPILGDKLLIKPPVPRLQLLDELNDMDFLLNFENLNTPSAVPSKLIDYSIVGRPILSVNQLDINKEAVNQFLNKDYTNKLVIKNIEQFQISNVAESFLNLCDNHTK